MSATPSLLTLLVQDTKAVIYQKALDIATSIGLPVTTWQAGDPTRSLYHLESEVLEALEQIVVNFIKSGFLDYAEGVWVRIRAQQNYGVEVPPATFATTTVRLTNTGGGNYPDIEPFDIVFKSSVNGKTYHNTTGGTLASGPGTTLDVDVEADEAGSDSSAGAGEIDEIVSGGPEGLLGVTCSNATAAVGIDEQSPETTKQQCRDSLGPLSPNGPSDAYSSIALNFEKTGTRGITRSRVYGDSETGDVTQYLAGPSGAISEPDRVLAEKAIVKWSTPLCITPALFSAANVAIDVTYEVWIYKSVNQTEAQVKAEIESQLEQMLAVRPIGGDIIPPSATGAVSFSMIESTVRGAFEQTFRASVTLPAGDTALANGEVAALGTVTGTVNFVEDP